jgi:hypothetical protein
MRLKIAVAMLFVVLCTVTGATLAQESPMPINPDPECDASEPVNERPAGPEASTFADWWHHEEGSELWASAFLLAAGDNKVGWSKPAGATITATGVRLDGEASPMIPYFPDGYSGTFQASGLYFPTGGCWEVSAEANGSALTFITYVYPAGYSYTPVGCEESIDQAIYVSAAVIVGEFEGAIDALEPFIWETIRIDDVVKGDVHTGDRLDILAFGGSYGQEFEIGERYLLFLWQGLGYHLRPYCQYAQIVDDQLVVNFDFGPLVDGQPLDEALESLRTAIQES